MGKLFTKKQANVIYSCFKQGKLYSPCPSPGFVYDYAKLALEEPKDSAIKSKLIALHNVTDMIFGSKYDEAQYLLNAVFWEG